MEYKFDARHHWERVSPTESRIEIDLDLDFDIQKNATVQKVRHDLLRTLASHILPQISEDAPAVANPQGRKKLNSDDDIATVDFNVSTESKEKWRKNIKGVNGALNGKVSISLKSAQPLSPVDAFKIAHAGIASNIAAHVATSYSRFVGGAGSAESEAETGWKGKRDEGSLKTSAKTKVIKDGAL